METFSENREIYLTECAVFRILTAAKGEIFMRAKKPNYNADRKAVVEVDAERFLALWRQPLSSHLDIALGNPQTWISDHEYRWAEDGFAGGAENPVPLAEVSCGRAMSDLTEEHRHLLFFTKEVLIARKGSPWLGFTNGKRSMNHSLAA